MTELSKPEIDFPGEEPPTDLVIEDITLGEGAEAVNGVTVSAHYVGVAHSTARSSTPRGTAGRRWTSGSASARSSAAGTKEGILGMRVGGRRRLVIPAHKPTATVEPVESSSRGRRHLRRRPHGRALTSAVQASAAAAMTNPAGSSARLRPMVESGTGEPSRVFLGSTVGRDLGDGERPRGADQGVQPEPG